MFSPLASLNTSAWAFKGDVCSYTLSTMMPCTSLILIETYIGTYTYTIHNKFSNCFVWVSPSTSDAVMKIQAAII